MTNFLIEADDYKKIELQINEIIKKEKFTDATTSYYDLEEVPLENALEDLDTYGFLSTKKIIIIKNIEFLDGEKNKEEIDHLYKYLNNSNPDNLLIIHARKLNNTTKFAKELKKLCNCIETEINSKEYIKELLKGYKITQEAIDLLNDYCLNDIAKINNECQKLINYKADTKEIKVEDIKEIVTKKIADSKDLTFAFIRCIGQKDKKGAFLKFQELLDYNIEPYSLLGLLGSQIRIIYQVKLLSSKHMNDKQITEALDEKSEYRIKKTRELVSLYSSEELLDMMQKISDIDFRIKTTDIDPLNEIKQFIINIE